jgi:hypothetical protein
MQPRGYMVGTTVGFAVETMEALAPRSYEYLFSPPLSDWLRPPQFAHGLNHCSYGFGP